MSEIKYKTRSRHDISRELLEAASDQPITLNKISIKIGAPHYFLDLVEMGFIAQIDETRMKKYKPDFKGYYLITPKGQVLLSLLNHIRDLMSGKDLWEFEKIPQNVVMEAKQRLVAQNFRDNEATEKIAIMAINEAVTILESLGAQIMWEKKCIWSKKGEVI